MYSTSLYDNKHKYNTYSTLKIARPLLELAATTALELGLTQTADMKWLSRDGANKGDTAHEGAVLMNSSLNGLVAIGWDSPCMYR